MRRNTAGHFFLISNRMFYMLICLFLSQNCDAQQKGKAWKISAGIHFPYGIFADTHFPGFGAIAEYSDHRFGQFTAAWKKKFGYLFTSGIDYFLGSTEKTSGYPFTYGGYTVFHLYGGLLYNAGKRTTISLAAGPALSLYNSTTRFNMGSNLSATYYLSDQWGISPAVMMIVETGARPLWAGSIKVSRIF